MASMAFEAVVGDGSALYGGAESDGRAQGGGSLWARQVEYVLSALSESVPGIEARPDQVLRYGTRAEKYVPS